MDLAFGINWFMSFNRYLSCAVLHSRTLHTTQLEKIVDSETKIYTNEILNLVAVGMFYVIFLENFNIFY